MTSVKSVKALDSPELDVEFTSQFYDQVKAQEIAKLNDLSKKATDAAALATTSSDIKHMSLLQVFHRTRDVLVDILQDLTAGKPLKDIFLATNRVFYVGIVMIVVALMIYVVDVTS